MQDILRSVSIVLDLARIRFGIREGSWCRKEEANCRSSAVKVPAGMKRKEVVYRLEVSAMIIS